MKRAIFFAICCYFFAIGLIAAKAAEPVQIKVSVSYPEPASPDVVFAIFNRPTLTGEKSQLTPWTTNSFAIISATNSSAFFTMAVSNRLTGEMGFSNERWIPLRIVVNLPVEASRQ